MIEDLDNNKWKVFGEEIYAPNLVTALERALREDFEDKEKLEIARKLKGLKMELTMEQSIVRQLDEMKEELGMWSLKGLTTRDQKLREKCDREIFRMKHKIMQVTEALINYRNK